MRELAILTFLTLDGVMQAPAETSEDRSGGFSHGGWAAPYWEPVMEQVTEEAMSSPYDLLIGRKTYEIFAPHWPNTDETPLSSRLNNATKYVVTNSLNEMGWRNSVPIGGDVVAAIRSLKNEDGPLLQVHGSWQLIQALLANDLIDEFRLWTFPVLVGTGKRLWETRSPIDALQLVKTRATPDGVVMSIYRRAGTAL